MKTFTQSAGIYSELGGDPDFAELVEMFVSELPNRVESIIVARQSDDFKTVCLIAHQLKGALGSYGFQELMPAATQLEELAYTAESPCDIDEAIATLVEACGRARCGVPNTESR